MKTIIVGAGEIGKSLYKVLEKEYEIVLLDKHFVKHSSCKILHVCFPFSEQFVKEVKRYKKLYEPEYVVIHSTVPVGTSKKCGAWHSPVIGIHPNLEQSIKTFDKFLGGENNSFLINYFRRAGIKVYPVDNSKQTELAKILCTTYYGVCIEFNKAVKQKFVDLKLPYEFWTIWVNNYNKGYKLLGEEQFVRPNLVPVKGKIGGHCVLGNTLLIDFEFARLVKELNK